MYVYIQHMYLHIYVYIYVHIGSKKPFVKKRYNMFLLYLFYKFVLQSSSYIICSSVPHPTCKIHFKSLQHLGTPSHVLGCTCRSCSRTSSAPLYRDPHINSFQIPLKSRHINGFLACIGLHMQKLFTNIIRSSVP